MSHAAPAERDGRASCELRVGGMDCASCASTITTALERLHGVEDVSVDVIGGRVRVRYAAGTLGRIELAGAIRRVGFAVEERMDQTASPAAAAFWPRRGRQVAAALSGAALGLALLVQLAGGPDALRLALLALSTVAGAWFVLPRGVLAARSLALDMNFLISVAAAGAWLIGEPTEAAATLFLFAIAELLETYSMDRARHAIRGLMTLSPAEATVLREGREERVPVASILVGETVLVRPGERIAVDGTVTAGRSSVNQAPITGESMPADKEPGAELFAGTLNGHGALHVVSSKPASDTTLARIVHAVEEAQASRAPVQRFVDRFARVYTPAVVLVALLVSVGPPLSGSGDWGTWLYRALAMLVIACPCALVISTPVSIVSGLAAAAHGGVLIKGGAHLEQLGTMTAVALDKTGTLTEGHPTVTDVVSLAGQSEPDAVRLALGVERHSEHPLARAVLAYGARHGVAPPDSHDFEALVGRGARAIVDGAPIYLGNERLCRELGTCTPAALNALARFEAEGKTAVVLTSARAPLAVIAIADRVRTEAAGALAELRALGVRRMLVLTGDNAGTAHAVAQQLGVGEVHAELLPEDKVRVVRALKASGERVAFVGDGINDAPAMGAADVALAMGAMGSDVALETADVALMSDDLSKLAFATRLSRRTLAVIRQNVIFSIALKAVFVVLALGGWATLWMAVAADMGASLLVVANGLRLLRTES